MPEAEFIARLRDMATHPAARGLLDDAAVLGDLVLTHDMIVEGVHYLPTDPPADVAWKLVAVNLSDLAAKGATPEGALLGFPLREPAWDKAFAEGLAEVLRHFGLPLLGGDTVAAPEKAPRMIGLTAIGRSQHAPDRRGAKAGDDLWLVGRIGDAGAGLAVALEKDGIVQRWQDASPRLTEAYRRPRPLLAEGQAIAPLVHAMADVSDGLMIDARRIADASGVAVSIDLHAVPRSPELSAFDGDDRIAVIEAITAGDDYALIFAASALAAPKIDALDIGAVRIGRFTGGSGIALYDGDGDDVPIPAVLGFEH
jgi:thiamine-monophosphate kinase